MTRRLARQRKSITIGLLSLMLSIGCETQMDPENTESLESITQSASPLKRVETALAERCLSQSIDAARVCQNLDRDRSDCLIVSQLERKACAHGQANARPQAAGRLVAREILERPEPGQEQQRRQSQEQPEAQVRRAPEVEDAERAPNADEQDDDDAEPAQRITCRHYCSNLGRRAYDGCIARNGDQRRCRQFASDRITECVERNCFDNQDEQPEDEVDADADEDVPVEPITCDDACQRRARAFFDSCVERGGDERRCGHAARELLTNCTERCIAERPEPRIPTCQDRCRQIARDQFNRCVSGGHAERVCRQRVGISLNRCMDRCDGGDEGAEETDDDVESNDSIEPTCTDRCGRNARAQYRRCIANGGAQRACREESAPTLYNMR